MVDERLMGVVWIWDAGDGHGAHPAHVRKARREGGLMLYAIGAVVCLLLLIYLFVAMLKPEVF